MTDIETPVDPKKIYLDARRMAATIFGALIGAVVGALS